MTPRAQPAADSPPSTPVSSPPSPCPRCWSWRSRAAYGASGGPSDADRQPPSAVHQLDVSAQSPALTNFVRELKRKERNINMTTVAPERLPRIREIIAE